jgi:hypothetical protein
MSQLTYSFLAGASVKPETEPDTVIIKKHTELQKKQCKALSGSTPALIFLTLIKTPSS